jgi:hypothetical protein
MKFLVSGLLAFCFLSVHAQKVDSAQTKSDSVAISFSRFIPQTEAGFTTYTSKSSLENYNAISPLHSLLTATPGLGMDPAPFSKASRFRSDLAAGHVSPMVVWDGVPYSFEHFSKYAITGFNTEFVSIAGASGFAGYGPQGANGGILVNSRTAKDSSDWTIDLNMNPILVNFEYGDPQLVMINNVSIAKAINQTRIRAFYNNKSESSANGHQAGISVATGYKIVSFESNTLFQRHAIGNEHYWKDYTIKGKLNIDFTSWLRTSFIAALDRNKYQFEEDWTQQDRLFYQGSIDLRKFIHRNILLTGGISYQRDSIRHSYGFYDDAYGRSKYKTDSWIGTVGFVYRGMISLRSIVQWNKYSAIRSEALRFPAVFGSLDVLRALNLSASYISSLTIHANYGKSFDYPSLYKRIDEYQNVELLPHRKSFESGLALYVSRTKSKLRLSYYANKFESKPERCPPNSGYCGTTLNTFDASEVNGVDIWLDQKASSSGKLNVNVVTGVSLSATRVLSFGSWSAYQKYRSLFAAITTESKYFFGNILINKLRKNINEFENQEIPVREFVIGYKILPQREKWISAARLSLVFRNLFTSNYINQWQSDYPAYPYYMLNISVRFN